MYFFHFFKILIFCVVSGVKGQKWSKLTKNSVCCAPYLKNDTSYDCHLWYACWKCSYLQLIFSFFQVFDFLGFKGGKRVKMAQNYKKFYLSHLYLRKHITYDHIILCTCVKWWHLQVLFSLIVGSTCFYMKSYLRSM